MSLKGLQCDIEILFGMDNMTSKEMNNLLSVLKKHGCLVPDNLHEERVFPLLKKLSDNADEIEITNILKQKNIPC